MSRTREILTVAGTLACAAGIGFIMQSSDIAEARYGKSEDDSTAVKGASVSDAILDVQEIKLTSAEVAAKPTLPATDSEVTTANAPQSQLDEPEVPELAQTDTQQPLAPACDITVDARPVAAAMVDLQMTAACFPNERVTVHHNGMIFTETTADDGSVQLVVPALSEEAVFIFAFANGDGAVAQTQVEELGNFDRAVLQWKGNAGFEIHAREFGADYGEPGHLWRGAPGDISNAVAGKGGVLIQLGDKEAADPFLAEVYSFPRDAEGLSGSIALSVETEVTAQNCGVEIEAQSLEVQAQGKIKTQNVTLPVPACDAVGSFLVLNNLLQDLKVASR
ncbi:hypothetical protein [Sulfitobacter sp. JB4-11]|uniref:hypothetical protein n=1 Tax=Sulfitobacter rhodophyticola TaxID=3238304 RepID=UPI0035144D8C